MYIGIARWDTLCARYEISDHVHEWCVMCTFTEMRCSQCRVFVTTDGDNVPERDPFSCKRDAEAALNLGP